MEFSEAAIEQIMEEYDSGLSMNAIASKHGVSFQTIQKVLKSKGVAIRKAGSPNQKGAPPPSLANVYQELKTAKAVAQHYSVRPEVVYRWLAVLQMSPRGSRTMPTVVPEDWNDVAPRMTQADLMRHYNCGRERIYKLIAVTGVQPMKHTDKPPKQKTVREITPKVVRSGLDRAREDLSHLTTKAEAAAHYLRRYYANVFRADIRYTDIGRETWGFREGLPDGGRHQYSVSGVGVLWLDELIELAEKRGWKEPLV